jgi:hypothetical protein
MSERPTRIPDPHPSLRLAALSLLACMMCLHCVFDDRLGGTSTTAENTITGVAMLPGGGPAAGAAVYARTEKVVLGPNRVPESKLIGFALAGKDGRFTLTVPDAESFTLEIKRREFDDVEGGHPFPEVYFRTFRDSLPALTALGNLDLAKSGSLSGRLIVPPDKEDTWIGIPGTGNFVRVPTPLGKDSSSVFTLNEVPSGTHSLVVFKPSEVAGTGTASVVGGDTVGTAEVRPETVEDVGTLTITVP